MDETPTEIALVTVPVTQPSLDAPTLSKLAREIVMEISERAIILQRFNITPEQFAALQENPFYKRVFEHYSIEWHSALTAQQRIKVQSAAALEDGLPHLGAKLSDSQEPLPAKVETGKLLAKLAGIGEGAVSGAPGEKFSIVINLSAAKKIEIEKTLDAVPMAEISEGGPTPLPVNGSGASVSETLERISRAAGEPEELPAADAEGESNTMALRHLDEEA